MKNKLFTNHSFFILFLAFAVFLLFGNTLQNGFVNFDDETYLIKNEAIKEFSWQSIKRIFTVPLGEYNIYRPLTYFFYAVEYAIAGLNPAFYHFVSVLLHFINSALVFYVVLRLTPNLMWLL